MRVTRALILFTIAAVVMMAIAGGASAAGIGPHKVRSCLQGTAILTLLILWLVRLAGTFSLPSRPRRVSPKGW